MRDQKQYSRISVNEVARVSRDVARVEHQSLDVIGVVPIEGGSDHVEVLVSLREWVTGPGRVSVLVDRAVPPHDLHRNVAASLRDALRDLTMAVTSPGCERTLNRNRC
jgi:hypothetical protein